MKCPLCGLEYSETEAVACRGCPLARSCALVRCPNCGYEVPAEPGLVKAIRQRRKKQHEARRQG
ncbi:MAG: hypothetical protein HY669_01290 [Chloroflexi bacterium]|nr:hypothetical protein [Chloroflexota bacterium]